MIKVTDYQKIETLYYEDISQRKYKNYRYKTLEKIYQERFEEQLGCDLRTLLCSPFDKLLDIKLPEEIREDIAEIFDYQNKYQQPISKILEFGAYLFDADDLHKRPLSKLTRDIAKELGLMP